MADERSWRKVRRVPTADERALWNHVADTATPLAAAQGRRAKPRVHPAMPEPDASSVPPVEPPCPQRTSASSAPGPAVPRGRRDPPRIVAMPPYAPPVSTPPRSAPSAAEPPERRPRRLPDVVVLDANTVRGLRNGRLAVEARLDLHGLRQDEARGALLTFLRACKARGHRLVLVITGKGGAPRTPLHPGADAADLWSWRASDQPGVLRRIVPEWLSSAEFRPLVVGTATAGDRHGGTGALYVQVRQRG